MTKIDIIFGEVIPGLDSSVLTLPAAKETFSAVLQHPRFTPLAIRKLIVPEKSVFLETIIVECAYDDIPTQNKVGIKYRETIALTFESTNSQMPEVFALRNDFPITLHQNHTPAGFPRSLCLYSDTWENLVHFWNPVLHLERILWWLKNTSEGTLHQDGQPIEQLFFSANSIFILPRNFSELVSDTNMALIIQKISKCFNGKETFRGEFVNKAELKYDMPVFPLIIHMDGVHNIPVREFPYTLGDLDSAFGEQSQSLANRLDAELKSKIPTAGIKRIKNGLSLIILIVPRVNEDGSIVERHDLHGFLIEDDVTTLGEAIEALSNQNGLYCNVHLMGDAPTRTDTWRNIKTFPVELSFSITKEYAQISSGIEKEKAIFNGVLAGVGSLGSGLADIWYRQGWGDWTFIDHDHIKPHNIARHIAKDFQVGLPKVKAVLDMVSYNYRQGSVTPVAILQNALNISDQAVSTSYRQADVIVDASASVAISRELSHQDGIARSCSVFLSKTANDSVLFFEDKYRNTRLDYIESQYYRAIIKNTWGEKHLGGHVKKFVTGVGCNDISAVLPYDMIQLHTSILARHIQLQKECPDAFATIWQCDPETSAVTPHKIIISPSIEKNVGVWRVIWSQELQDELMRMRNEGLPQETGGILLGYFDYKHKKLYVVDALPAPPDSRSSETSFVRGIRGVYEKVLEIESLTDNAVKYIGDWHSHPPHSSSQPSTDDLYLACFLGETFSLDGHPAVMMIASETDISTILCSTL